MFHCLCCIGVVFCGVNRLLQAGGDVLQQDRHGWTPVHYMVQQDEDVCLLLCLEHFPMTSLHAEKTGMREKLREIRQREGQGVSDVCCVLNDLNTPLHMACKHGAQRCMRMLCRWDADAPLLGEGGGSVQGSGSGKEGHDEGRRTTTSISTSTSTTATSATRKHITARKGSLLERRNKQGKTPVQLLPASVSASVMDSMWSCCRRGNADRCHSLFIHSFIHSFIHPIIH